MRSIYSWRRTSWDRGWPSLPIYSTNHSSEFRLLAGIEHHGTTCLLFTSLYTCSNNEITLLMCTFLHWREGVYASTLSSRAPTPRGKFWNSVMFRTWNVTFRDRKNGSLDLVMNRYIEFRCENWKMLMFTVGGLNPPYVYASIVKCYLVNALFVLQLGWFFFRAVFCGWCCLRTQDLAIIVGLSIQLFCFLSTSLSVSHPYFLPVPSS